MKIVDSRIWRGGQAWMYTRSKACRLSHCRNTLYGVQCNLCVYRALEMHISLQSVLVVVVSNIAPSTVTMRLPQLFPHHCLALNRVFSSAALVPFFFLTVSKTTSFAILSLRASLIYLTLHLSIPSSFSNNGTFFSRERRIRQRRELLLPLTNSP